MSDYGTYESYEEQVNAYSRMCRAFREGSVERLDQAIADGDNPFYRQNDGYTMMHYAVGRGENAPPLMERLGDYGLDVNKAAYDGRQPIHEAIIRNDVPSMHCLLAMGADASATLANGFNGFHLLGAESNPQIPRLLYRHGVDPDHVNRDGKTPDEHFQSQGQGWLLESFEQWKEQQRTAAPELSDGTPLETIFAADGTFTQDETTMRSWKMLPRMVEKAKSEGVEIAPEALANIAKNASNHGILPQVMQVLHEHEMHLPLHALVDEQGQAKEALSVIAHNWDVKAVLNPENCKNQPKSDVSRVHEALSEQQQQQVRNLHRIRMAAGNALPTISR